jgi:hypothetical protein
MVVQKQKDPNWVWNLQGVVPPANHKKAFYCRVSDTSQAAEAGIKVKDWTSLDGHPELILWTIWSFLLVFRTIIFVMQPERRLRQVITQWYHLGMKITDERVNDRAVIWSTSIFHP